MAVLRSLVTTLGLNSAQYREELKKASNNTKQWSSDVEKYAKRAAQMFYTYVAVQAVGALKTMYDEQAAAIDQQAKFADKIGITTDALAGLQHAGELTGVATNQLNTGLQRMTRRVAEAAKGTGEAQGALEQLGLSAKDLNELSPDQQFQAIAGAMAEVEGRSEKLRLAFKLFDSEGTAMLNTLDMGVDGLRIAAKEAESYGIALSRVDAQKVENANDQVYRAGLLSQGFAKHLSAELSPMVEAVANQFIGVSVAAGGMGEVATTAVGYIVTGLDVLYIGLLGIKNGWNIIKLATLTTATAIVDGIRAMEYEVVGFLNLLPGVEVKVSESIGNTLAYLRGETKTAFNDMTTNAVNWKNQIVGVFDGAGKIKGITDNIREQATAAAAATVATKKYGKSLESLNQVTLPSPSISGNLEKDLEKLRDGLADKEQLLIEQTQKELGILKAAREQELITQQEYDQLERELYKQRFEEYTTVSEDFWTQFAGHVEKSVTDFDTMWGNAFDRFAAGFGDAVADSILEGKNFGEVMAGVAQGLAKSMISSLVEIAAKKATLWLMERTLLKGQQAGFVAKVSGEAQAGAQLAAINSYASAAAIPVYGWAIAPEVAAAALTATEIMAGAATTAAAGSMAGMAHDGIDYVPREGTWLLDRGERVVDSRTNEDLKTFLSQSGGNQGNTASNQPQWIINVNEAPPGTTATIDEANQIITIAVKKSEENTINQIRRGGPITKAGQQHLNWQRNPSR